MSAEPTDPTTAVATIRRAAAAMRDVANGVGTVYHEWTVEAPLGGRERAAKYPPSGCLHCDIGQRDHGRQWTFSPTNWHEYTPPTTDQTLTRMLARRYGSAADAQNTNTEK